MNWEDFTWTVKEWWVSLSPEFRAKITAMAEELGYKTV